jgi:nucleotide-binding universal stress UspA family protein
MSMSIQDSRRTIVVGVDGSDEATRAVRWGAVEAARRQAPLRLVMAFGWPPEPALGYSTFREDYRELLRSRAESRLEAARSVAEQSAPGVHVDIEVVDGTPYAVLGTAARSAQLMVLGSRGLGQVEGLLAGSVTVALAAHAACPVVVVRGDERDPADAAALPVVVGVDGTPASEAAIAFAFEAAAARGVPLVAVHVWTELAVTKAMEPFADWPAIKEEEQRLDRGLADLLARWSEKHPGVQVRRIVAHERPGRCLVEQSVDAQLVVVGSRGHGELAGMVLGSVSNALVHRSRCPVAVVRA